MAAEFPRVLAIIHPRTQMTLFFETVNPPKEGTPKLQSKPRGQTRVMLGNPGSHYIDFIRKKAVWLFPSAEAHLNPIDRGLLDRVTLI